MKKVFFLLPIIFFLFISKNSPIYAFSKIDFSDIKTEFIMDKDKQRAIIRLEVEQEYQQDEQSYTLQVASLYDECTSSFSYVSEYNKYYGECDIPMADTPYNTDIAIKIIGNQDFINYYSKEVEYYFELIQAYIKDGAYFIDDLFFKFSYLPDNKLTGYYSQEDKTLTLVFKKYIEKEFIKEKYDKTRYRDYTRMDFFFGDYGCTANTTVDEVLSELKAECDIKISLEELVYNKYVALSLYFNDKNEEETLGFSGLQLPLNLENLEDLDTPLDWSKLVVSGEYKKNTQTSNLIDAQKGTLEIIFSIPIEKDEYPLRNYPLELIPLYEDKYKMYVNGYQVFEEGFYPKAGFIPNKETNTLQATIKKEDIKNSDIADVYKLKYKIPLEKNGKGYSQYAYIYRNDVGNDIYFSQEEQKEEKYLWKNLGFDMYYDKESQSIKLKGILDDINSKPREKYSISIKYGRNQNVKSDLVYDSEKKQLYFTSELRYSYDKDSRNIELDYTIKGEDYQAIGEYKKTQRLNHLKKGFDDIAEIDGTQQVTIDISVQDNENLEKEERKVSPKIVTTLEKYIQKVEKKYKNDSLKIHSYIEKTIVALDALAEKKEKYREMISDINFVLQNYLDEK